MRAVPHGYEEFDPRDTLPGVVAKRAAWTPDRPWVVDLSNDRTTTFAEAHELFLTWADALVRFGVAPGDRVASMMPNSIERAAAWLGTAWARGLDVPLNTAFRGSMLRYTLENSGASVAFVAPRFLDRVAEVAGEVPALRTVVVTEAGGATPPPLAGGRVAVIGIDEFLAGATPARDLATPEPWDVATIAYTSGTTGPSKGVVLPWGMVTFGMGLLDDLGPDDAMYSPFPMFHMSGMGTLAATAYMGGRSIIREAFDTTSFWGDIDTHGATMTLVVPAMAHWLLSQPPAPDDREHALRHVIISPIIHAFGERFGVTMRTHYGMTEAGNVMSRRNVTDESATCGTPRPGYEVRLVDEHDYEVPVGEIGELVVRTAEPWWLCIGYWDMPEKTAEAWRNGWFHTGDGFRRDEAGNYYFVDRQKDAIRRRGENISSFEVEQIVLQHDAIAECAAIGVETSAGEQDVKVCVVLHDGFELDPAHLVEFLVPLMPRYMIPRFVEVMEGLPKTEATMRIQKAELRREPLGPATWDREQAGIVLSK
ncbi:MAG TPA: AMP-binding protein [Acidimicrobiia bacterium]